MNQSMSEKRRGALRSIVRPYLVRGAFYRLVVAVICVVPFALPCSAAMEAPTLTAFASVTVTPRPRPTPAPRPQPPPPSPTPTAASPTVTPPSSPTPTPTATLTPPPSPTPTPTATPAPPVAQPATYVASNSFTANWSSVSGATGYRLDVSTSSSFSTYVTGYHNLDVGNAISRSVTGLTASTKSYYRVSAYNGGG